MAYASSEGQSLPCTVFLSVRRRLAGEVEYRRSRMSPYASSEVGSVGKHEQKPLAVLSFPAGRSTELLLAPGRQLGADPRPKAGLVAGGRSRFAGVPPGASWSNLRGAWGKEGGEAFAPYTTNTTTIQKHSFKQWIPRFSRR